MLWGKDDVQRAEFEKKLREAEERVIGAFERWDRARQRKIAFHQYCFNEAVLEDTITLLTLTENEFMEVQLEWIALLETKRKMKVG
jgi:hypothetical protein